MKILAANFFMKAKKLFAFFVLLVGSSSLKAESNDYAIPIVKNGKSPYVIFVGTGAGVAEKKAALLLQNYIYKISGCKLPTSTVKTSGVFSIKKSINIKNPDGFTIITKGSDINIEGGADKGCIYAVISLLEQYLGCRYYSKSYKVIPKSINISLPAINFSDQPKNYCRIVYFNEKVDEEYLDWNRLNMADEYFADGYYVHTFHYLVPPKENFLPHPEYFSLVNGRRVTNQLCLTNPEVLRLVIAKLEKDIPLQPGKLYWSVSQNDNNTYCTCENCEKVKLAEGSPAGTIIRFVNEVAKHFPKKIISTLAYQYSRHALKITRPAANVQVMLCTIEVNRSQPIEQDPGSQSFVKDITDWGKICNNIYLWDYVIDFAHSISPFPNLHVLQPNIQFFYKNQARMHFQQANTSTGLEFSELKVYLISRLVWNPDINVSKAIDEFLIGYYGKASPFIKNYINRMQTGLIKSGDRLDIYEHPLVHRNGFLSLANVNKYNDFFDQAEVAVRDDSARLIHVKISRLPLQYAMMEIGKTDIFGTRGWYIERNNQLQVEERMKRIMEDFNNICIKASVPYINESRLSPKLYYEASKRLLDIEVNGNYAFRKKVTSNALPSPDNSNGDLSILTNGVKGGSDYKVQWIGWQGTDFNLEIDMQHSVRPTAIAISSLWDPSGWILHPASISCLVSNDGKKYIPIGKIFTEGDQQKENINREFEFKLSGAAFRYVKLEVKSTLVLPFWHGSAGMKSWVFVDEIVVR